MIYLNFQFCHRFSIGFKSRLIEGHGRTVIFFFWIHPVNDLDVCLWSLSCWKVNHQLRSRFCTDSCRFSFRILISSSDFIILLTAINCPVLLELQHPQNIIEPPLCFNVSTVFMERKTLPFTCQICTSSCWKKLSFSFIIP